MEPNFPSNDDNPPTPGARRCNFSSISLGDQPIVGQVHASDLTITVYNNYKNFLSFNPELRMNLSLF